MDRFIFYVLGFLAGLLQVTFISGFEDTVGRISLVIIGISAVMLFRNNVAAYHFALSAGIVSDIFLPYPFGITTLLLLSIVFVLEIALRTFFQKSSLLAQIAVASFSTAVLFLGQYLFIHLFNAFGIIQYSPRFGVEMMSGLAGSIIGNAVLLVLAMKVLNYFDEIVQNRVYQRSRYHS